MKKLLLTLLSVVGLITISTEAKISKCGVAYDAKLVKTMPYNEYKSFSFTSTIHLDTAKETAHITITSYQDVGNIYCHVDKDILKRAVYFISLWLKEKSNVQTLIVSIVDYDGNLIVTYYSMRECERYLAEDGWKITLQ